MPDNSANNIVTWWLVDGSQMTIKQGKGLKYEISGGSVRNWENDISICLVYMYVKI